MIQGQGHEIMVLMTENYETNLTSLSKLFF